MRVMSDVAQDAWEALLVSVRRYADSLGLRDWQIEVVAEPPDDEDAVATIEPVDGRRMAQLRVCIGWEGMSQDARRHAICHELLHLHFAEMCLTVRRDVPEWMPPRTWEMFWGQTMAGLESGIDGLAVAVARSLPEYGF